MKRLVLLLCLFAAAAEASAQSENDNWRSGLAAALNFEAAHSGSQPAGWGGGPPGTIAVDGDIVHGGKWSVRLERTAKSPQRFTTITRSIPIDFAGRTIEWRGFMRTEDVSEFAGLWLREDGDTQ